jgi:hypothetical protein
VFISGFLFVWFTYKLPWIDLFINPESRWIKLWRKQLHLPACLWFALLTQMFWYFTNTQNFYRWLVQSKFIGEKSK